MVCVRVTQAIYHTKHVPPIPHTLTWSARRPQQSRVGPDEVKYVTTSSADAASRDCVLPSSLPLAFTRSLPPSRTILRASAAAAWLSPSRLKEMVRGVASKMDSKSSRPALTVTGRSGRTSHTGLAAVRKLKKYGRQKKEEMTTTTARPR